MTDLHQGDVSAFLTDLRQGLRSDGYELDVVATSPKVEVAISAGPDACEDCLVPKDLMARYVVNALRELDDELTTDDVVLTYPGE